MKSTIENNQWQAADGGKRALGKHLGHQSPDVIDNMTDDQKRPALARRIRDAVAHFDRLSVAGQFTGAPALALKHTARTFGLCTKELRQAILAARWNESHT